MEEAVLILVFLFVTLRAILQSRRRLNCRPGFIAGQYRHVALIWSDTELFTPISQLDRTCSRASREHRLRYLALW